MLATLVEAEAYKLYNISQHAASNCLSLSSARILSIDCDNDDTTNIESGQVALSRYNQAVLTGTSTTYNSRHHCVSDVDVQHKSCHEKVKCMDTVGTHETSGAVEAHGLVAWDADKTNVMSKVNHDGEISHDCSKGCCGQTG